MFYVRNNSDMVKSKMNESWCASEQCIPFGRKVTSRRCSGTILTTGTTWLLKEGYSCIFIHSPECLSDTNQMLTTHLQNPFDSKYTVNMHSIFLLSNIMIILTSEKKI